MVHQLPLRRRPGYGVHPRRNLLDMAFVEDKALLALRRLEAPAPVLKKTPPASSLSSSNSGKTAAPPSTSNESPTTRKPSR